VPRDPILFLACQAGVQRRTTSVISSSQFRWLLFVLGGAWALALAAGSLVLLQHENTPGPATATANRWPADSHLVLDSDQPTLVLFAHPRCPCTRATLEQLGRLLSHCRGRVRASVLFYQPAGASEDWARTDLWSSAAANPGVAVAADVEGAEARRFGVRTSGHVVLYAPDGRRLFSGGITGSRGHAGDNAGHSALLALLTGAGSDTVEFPVFGCGLCR
jgi:hypothetical protein